jgi:hypothetical protein
MTHYRSLLDHEFLGAWDLQRNGKPMDVTITIGAVEQVEVFDPKTNKPGKKLVIIPRERPERKLVLSKTLADSIAALHGTDADKWPGCKITLYAAMTSFGKQRVDCIRIRLPPEVLRDSPVIRSRVRAKMLQEIGWEAVQPKSREERQGEAATAGKVSDG